MSDAGAIVEKAVNNFRRGYNCAQSVLLAMAEYWKIETDLIPKIATGFGGGIGRCGSACGALTGGVLALGIKHGSNEPSVDTRSETYDLARKLYKRFEQLHGSTMCRQLIDYDLLDEEQLQKARNENVFEAKCHDFVRTIIRTIFELEKKE